MGGVNMYKHVKTRLWHCFTPFYFFLGPAPSASSAHVDKTSGGSRESLAAVFVGTGTGASWAENSDLTGEYPGKNMLLDLPKEDKSKMCTYVVMLRICFTDFSAEHVGFYLCWILLWKMLISIYQHT